MALAGLLATAEVIDDSNSDAILNMPGALVTFGLLTFAVSAAWRGE